MFKGADIPGIYTISSLADRSIYVFRHRALSYMLITLCTYGICALGIAVAYADDVVADVQAVIYYGPGAFGNSITRYFYFLSIPSVLADLALQEYTSHLVREQEIPWHQAIFRIFSVKTINYILVRVVGFFVLYIVATATAFFAVIPFIGGFIYLFIVAGAYAYIVGMTHAITVEERVNFLWTIGRNMGLAGKNLGLSAFGSFSGLMIVMGLVVSGVIFIYCASLIVFRLAYGNIVSPEDELSYVTLVVKMMLFAYPLLMALFYIPVSNLFFSLMYYHFRSKQEGFHLENKLNIRLREIQANIRNQKAPPPEPSSSTTA